MIDFLIFVSELVLTPSRAWIGILIGILVAACIYFFVPESEIRNILAIGSVVTGFLAGFILSADPGKR